VPARTHRDITLSDSMGQHWNPQRLGKWGSARQNTEIPAAF
jgi:hypothetical protein